MGRRSAYWGLLLVTAACDPGWSYVLPDAKPVRANGIRYVVSVAEGVEGRFYADVFTIRGHSEIQVINRSDKPIRFDPLPTLVNDTNGRSVEPRTCEFSTGAAPAIVGKDQMATVSCGFQVDFGSVWYYNRAFSKLTFVQPGFSENGRQLPVIATMEWVY